MVVSLEDLKFWLGISGTDAARDEQLTKLESRTVAFVEPELGWYFGEPRLATVEVAGNGQRLLYLRQPRVIGDSYPVRIRLRGGLSDEWVDLAAEDFRIMGRELISTSYWPLDQVVEVQLWEGFPDGAPGEIQQLVLDLAKVAWLGRGLNPGMRSESIGDYSYTRADTKDIANWSDLTRRWRRGRI